jgi:hypothetical protein
VRERLARTFADVLSGRFGGRWSVEWEGADTPSRENRRPPRPDANRACLLTLIGNAFLSRDQ